MADALIPVGSVVRLEGVDLLAVVLGYFVDDGERMYDYLLAPYPVGLDSTEHAILVDAEGIAEVVARGYLDEEGERALTAAAEMMEAKEEAYIAAGRELDAAGLFVDADEAFSME